MKTSIVSDTANMYAVDLGCGPNKVPGALGVDHFPYPGVDIVFDLDSKHWPLKSNLFTMVYVHHVIEHVSDIRAFLNEIHRIGVNGAIIEIVTPHFSSLDSWKDPTHRWHFSSSWYLTFTANYLSEQVQSFEHRSTRVSFGKNIRNLIARSMIRMKGYEWWEKHYAFIYRARNISTQLKITKVY